MSRKSESVEVNKVAKSVDESAAVWQRNDCTVFRQLSSNDAALLTELREIIEAWHQIDADV